MGGGGLCPVNDIVVPPSTLPLCLADIFDVADELALRYTLPTRTECSASALRNLPLGEHGQSEAARRGGAALGERSWYRRYRSR